jgi:hypothetical protein
MSTPSLLNIPYLIKAGTLYSQIPETGLGDFAVTRVTSPTTNRSTRVNADGFIELVNDGVPRLDYPLGGAVNGCASLLVEPSAVNLALQSEAFNTTWTNVSNNLSISTNVSSTLDPAGGNTADLLTVVSGSTQSELSQTITVVSGTSYVFSIFGKKGSGATHLNSVRVIAPSTINTVTINWDTGVLTQTGSGATSQNYGNGWWRIIIPFTASSTSAIIQAVTYVTYTAGISSLRWGAQLEVGTVPTSYIPTTTAAITRGADEINKTGVSSLIGQTEGTIYLEIEIRATSSPAAMIVVLANDSGLSQYIRITRSSNQFLATVLNGSATNLFTSATGTVGFYKLALAYKSGDNAMSINGATPLTSANTSNYPTSLTRIMLSEVLSGGFRPLNGPIRAFALYPNRLSNAELIALTTP